MANMTGWTWDQCRDQLDLPRVEAMRAAWKDNPPLVITMRLAAEGLGASFGKPASGSSSSSEILGASPHALLAELGQDEPMPYIRPAMGLRITSPEVCSDWGGSTASD